MVESLGQDHRHVFAAVDRKVDFTGEQRVLDFLDEEPLAADLRQRVLRQVVSPDVRMTTISHSDTGLRAQLRRDGVGLKQRELAAARADPENHDRLDDSDASSSCSLKRRLTASV